MNSFYDKRAIVLPYMNEGKMTDAIPVRARLEANGCIVLEPNLYDPNALRDLPWKTIDVVDLRYARGSLTNFEKYIGILNRLHDKIEVEKENGHIIKIIPDYNVIRWLSSKANYIGYVIEKGIPTAPMEFVQRHSSNYRPSTEEPDNIKEAIHKIESYISKRKVNKFVLKPSISSLAKSIVFIEKFDNESVKVSLPKIDSLNEILRFSSIQDFSKNFLRTYLQMINCHDETFLIQDYIKNVEVSCVYINSKPHFIERIPGQSGVAHNRYGGTDRFLRAPDEKLKNFSKAIMEVLPSSVQNSPFLRIDVMWDLDRHQYLFAEIEGAGASRLWIEEANRVNEYADMLLSYCNISSSMVA